MREIKIPKKERKPEQEELYKGLKLIGDEVASFYSDALDIIESSLKTKSYLLAHLAREIDGGLRDILASKSILNENKSLTKNEKKELLEEINLELKSKGLGKLNNKISGNITSICNALDLGKDKELIKKWLIISAQFNRFVHRRGAYKEVREFNLFKDVWDIYENILFRLFGSNLILLRRVDHIISKEKPSRENFAKPLNPNKILPN